MSGKYRRWAKMEKKGDPGSLPGAIPKCFKKEENGCWPLGSPLSGLLLTWSPPHRPLATAAETHFAEHPEDVPLA